MIKNAAYWVNRLRLQKHPEGGFFRETYRAEESMPANALPQRFKGARSFATAIYFLLQGREVSRFHRIQSDELWHFYTGSALTVHVLNPAGHYTALRLGADPVQGHEFQARIRSGCWFGATVNDPRSYALVGCTVAPGFDFADFELADRHQLLSQYPQHIELIKRLTQ